MCWPQYLIIIMYVLVLKYITALFVRCWAITNKVIFYVENVI